MAEITQTISAMTGDPPDRGTMDQATFDTAASTFADKLANDWAGSSGEFEAFRTQTNALRTEVNASRDAAITAQGVAEDASAVAQATAHFAGTWSSLTGALAKPASVFHDSVFWMLLENLVDVTLSEPSAVNTDWAEIIDTDTLKPSDIGTTVQAYDADTAKTDTAQTWTAKQKFGSTAETWAVLSGSTPSITAGSYTWTLTDNSTPTNGLSDGDYCILMINDGADKTIDWSSVVDQWDGGSAPILPLSGYLTVVLWNVDTTVYGSFGAGVSAP